MIFVRQSIDAPACDISNDFGGGVAEVTTENENHQNYQIRTETQRKKEQRRKKKKKSVNILNK